MADYVSDGNPVNNMKVIPNPDDERGGWIIGVEVRCECGSECCSRPVVETRPHTAGHVFDEADDAHEWLDSLAEKWEDDYDRYLDENSYAIRQSELYDMWRNEY